VPPARLHRDYFTASWRRGFPFEVRPSLNVIAQLGLIIFLFIVGLEPDGKLIQGQAGSAAITSSTSTPVRSAQSIAPL